MIFSPFTQPSDSFPVADGLVRWWRQGVGIATADAAERVSGWTDVISGTVLAQATPANQPIYLPHTGSNYLWLPGVASNNVTAPTKSITGNFTITIDFAALNWTPGADMGIINKAPSPSGFIVNWVNAGSLPNLQIGDGATLNSATAVSSPSWTNGTRHTLKIVWQDGVGVTFFYDGVQSGSQVALAKTMTNGSNVFNVGTATATGLKIYSVSITDGASTTYYSVNFTQVPEGTTSFTQNGDTYTVNSTGVKPAQIVGSPQLLGDGAAYYLRASYTQAQPVTRMILARPNVWTNGAYLMDSATGTAAQNALFQNTSTPRVAMYAGATVGELSAAILGSYHAYAAVFNSAGSSLQVDTTSSGTVDAGTSAGGGLTILANGAATAAAFSAHQAKEILEYNRALSVAEINQGMRYLSRIGNLGLAI